MRRISVELDEDLHKWVRGYAVQEDTTMSNIVRGLLGELMASDSARDRSRRVLAGTGAPAAGREASERAALRGKPWRSESGTPVR